MVVEVGNSLLHLFPSFWQNEWLFVVLLSLFIEEDSNSRSRSIL